MPEKGDHGNITTGSWPSAVTGTLSRSAAGGPAAGRHRTAPHPERRRRGPGAAAVWRQTIAASARACRTASTASSPGLEVTNTSIAVDGRGDSSRNGPPRTRSAMVQTRRVDLLPAAGRADRTSRRPVPPRRGSRGPARREHGPAAVGSAPRGVRSKRSTPSSRSSARICWEGTAQRCATGERPRRSAARRPPRGST